ncbi:MAG TPA: hypothetical protein VLT79_00025 [Gemmatimonadales bacterium]|nr:hypothetical protein [Gemmatimonadales bacterium]
MRTLVPVSVVLLLAGPVPEFAQSTSASPYVPIAHWSMPFIEQLIDAGVIPDPTPLTRPFKQRDVLRSLRALDTTRLDATTRQTIRRILREWQADTTRPTYRIELSAGAQASNYAFRDPLELGRDTVGATTRLHVIDSRAYGSAGGEADLRFGPFVAVSHLVVDTRVQHDPDWYGAVDNATRFNEAYVNGQWRHAEVFFGILDRNWGPSGVQGLLLSPNPYGPNHLELEFGTARVKLQSVSMQLDTRDSAGRPINRYLIENRLWLNPKGRWTLAIWDASAISGTGRQLEPWFLNPAGITYFASSNTGTNGNNFLGVDVERHGKPTLFGQFMIDDIQVSRNDAADYKPASYGLTIGAKGPLAARTSWLLFYTQVANLTYRNEDDLQTPQYHNLPSGRNFDDYDQATAKLRILAARTLVLEPELTVLRQGEGDPRKVHPLVPQYLVTPVLFQGVVQRTVLAALAASWQMGDCSIVANGGVHFTSNAGHVTGVSHTQFVGSLAVTYRFHHEAPLP